MLRSEGHGHIPQTSTAAFLYPRLPAINFSRFFAAVFMLNKGKIPTLPLTSSLSTPIYIYSQTSPKLLPSSGLVWRRRDPTMGSFGPFCGCGSPFLLQTFFLFLPFLFFF